MSERVGFIPQAVAVEDCLHNSGFQLDNIRGYLVMAREHPEDAHGAIWMAMMKAEAMVEASQGLRAALAARLAELEKAKGGAS